PQSPPFQSPGTVSARSGPPHRVEFVPRCSVRRSHRPNYRTARGHPGPLTLNRTRRDPTRFRRATGANGTRVRRATRTSRYSPEAHRPPRSGHSPRTRPCRRKWRTGRARSRSGPVRQPRDTEISAAAGRPRPGSPDRTGFSHARKLFGGGLYQGWPYAAVALHYLDGFPERFRKAVATATAPFARLGKPPRFR